MKKSVQGMGLLRLVPQALADRVRRDVSNSKKSFLIVDVLVGQRRVNIKTSYTTVVYSYFW